MEQVFELLTNFYAAMGNPPETDGGLSLMAAALAAHAKPELVNSALDRCMVECRFPVRLPDIFQRIAGFDVDGNAEKRLAWETLEKFAGKWLRWDSERIHAYVEEGAPVLSPQILDTVRRSGGWSVYLRMTDDDFPHVQKRFFEEYLAWNEIQHVAMDPSKLLEMPRARELVAAKTMDKLSSTETPVPSRETAAPPKPYSPAPTPAELRDRAASAKAQLAEYLKNKPAGAGEKAG